MQSKKAVKSKAILSDAERLERSSLIFIKAIERVDFLENREAFRSKVFLVESKAVNQTEQMTFLREQRDLSNHSVEEEKHSSVTMKSKDLNEGKEITD
jgi:hypothetical protein